MISKIKISDSANNQIKQNKYILTNFMSRALFLMLSLLKKYQIRNRKLIFPTIIAKNKSVSDALTMQATKWLPEDPSHPSQYDCWRWSCKKISRCRKFHSWKIKCFTFAALWWIFWKFLTLSTSFEIQEYETLSSGHYVDILLTFRVFRIGERSNI
jgi:hypothetical protein